jgi:fatty-acyl-CoA synthase
VVCAWHDEWDELPSAERARLKARHGVTYPVLEGLTVADPVSLAPVPADGATMGEIFMRGNIVMKGYLKSAGATEEAFAGGWFHSGDLGVMHPDGYIELKDRSKDIIISGGENISTIEVEDVLHRHPCRARSRGGGPSRCDVGRNTLRVCDPEARSRGLGGRHHHLLPHPPRPFPRRPER